MSLKLFPAKTDICSDEAEADFFVQFRIGNSLENQGIKRPAFPPRSCMARLILFPEVWNAPILENECETAARAERTPVICTNQDAKKNQHFRYKDILPSNEIRELRYHWSLEGR